MAIDLSKTECKVCGRPSLPSLSVCGYHKRYDNAQSDRPEIKANQTVGRRKSEATYHVKRAERRARGVCMQCASANTNGRVLCVDCRVRTNEKNKADLAQAQANGLCRSCRKTQYVLGHSQCTECIVRHASLRYTGTSKNTEALLELFIRQEGRCVYTGWKITIGVNADLDHIVPLYQGGSSEITNFQWIWNVANEMKGSMMEEDFLKVVTKICKHRKLM